MTDMQWFVELALIGLLTATLFYALRLERALGVLKRDRAGLAELVAGFNASTRQAEAGIERLHIAAESAGRDVARHVDTAAALKDDLVFLVERGDSLADRLDALVRSARPLERVPEARRSAARPEAPMPVRIEPLPDPDWAELVGADAPMASEPRVRSQAERDLLRALKLGR